MEQPVRPQGQGAALALMEMETSHSGAKGASPTSFGSCSGSCSGPHIWFCRLHLTLPHNTGYTFDSHFANEESEAAVDQGCTQTVTKLGFWTLACLAPKAETLGLVPFCLQNYPLDSPEIFRKSPNKRQVQPRDP